MGTIGFSKCMNRINIKVGYVIRVQLINNGNVFFGIGMSTRYSAWEWVSIYVDRNIY